MTTTMTKVLRAVSLAVVMLTLIVGAQAQQPTAAAPPVRFDADTISGLGARNIGSAAMSGRIAALDAVREKDRLTIYVGAASGGVWKSVNNGTTFKPVFDKQPVQSIGAVTIDPKNPKVVWVGTGEPWTRNSVSIGDGVYKSTDGGENWTNVGLKETERIAKILVDPAATDTVYVCAPGKLWSDNDERGLYKTTDGGKTWAKILKGGNLSTGCGMASMSEQDPKTLYAGMWDFRRKGWTFRSGGEGPKAFSGSGLFKTTDGGSSWTELDGNSAKGLPPKPWGRIAVTVAPSNQNIVYAAIEAEGENAALYRSDDGGKTWDKRDRSQNMIWRPFYFANLIVDPKNPEKVYKTNLFIIASNDGGKSFTNIYGQTHVDSHDLWINPENTDHLLMADDGGLWFSYDGGNRWVKNENLPISQFYHVSADMDMPYKVYGGLQDNSSWVGDSQYPGGITNNRWENLYGGDGFWVFADTADPEYVYAEFQGGGIARINRKTLQNRNIQPLANYGEKKLRFNWNAPIHLSPTQKGVLYIGAQFLFRSKDSGQTWDRISPDLTTNDPEKQKQEESGGITVDNSAAEMHTTIYAIAESPKNPQLVWVGTDDGNVQITRDGGKTWTNVIGNVQGIPKNTWVSSIEASRFDEGTAYVTFDAHTFGDMRPYVYKTSDYGKTWSSLVAANSPMRGYAHVVKQDTVRPELLFAGTEFGLWISIDGGRQWAQYKGNDFPNVAVRDVVIHPRDSDLVIGTHGRGIWIVDDITPLRNLSADALTQEAAFVAGKASIQRLPAQGGWPGGDAVFEGANPPDAAVINYYQRKRHIFGDLKIEILDDQGKFVASVPSSKRRGLNRATWPMRLPPPKVPPAATAAFGAAFGPRVLPGTYTVRMTKDKNVYTTPLVIRDDPRAKFTPAERREQYELSLKLYRLLGRMSWAADSIVAVKDGATERASKLNANDSLRKRLETLSAKMDDIRKKVVATKEGGAITGEERLREFITDLYGNVVFYEGKPSAMQVMRTDALSRELDDVIKEYQAATEKELPAVNAALSKKKLEAISPPTEADWQKANQPAGSSSAAATPAFMRGRQRL